MESNNLEELETSIKKFSDLIIKVADTSDTEELINIIRNPGWTTPAERIFVKGIVDSLYEHTVLIEGLKQSLMNGSRMVGN